MHRSDPTWGVVSAEDWEVVEISSGLICASLVPLRPVFKKLFGCSRERTRQMAQQKSHAEPVQICHNLDCGSGAQGGMDFSTKMATLTICARNSDIERCEGIISSDVSVLRSEFRQLNLPVFEKALTRDHTMQ